MSKLCRIFAAAILISASGLAGACSKAGTQTISGKQKEELIAFAKTVHQIAQDSKPREFLKASLSKGRELKEYYDFLHKIKIGDKPEWRVESNQEDANDYFVFFKTSGGITVTMEISREKNQELKFCSITD